MADNQELVMMKPEEKEREIPVFTVMKNNCTLKNIFLLDNPPSISSSPSYLVAQNADQDSEIDDEEVLVVGRHPDCNIKVEHPSISRFHLRIHSTPSARSLFVTDLSSVHGTWISGKRIEPEVKIKLNEGDMLRLGASSRLYQLNWVPLSCAYDTDKPFVPQLDVADSVEEETEEAVYQDENSSSHEKDQEQTLSDHLEILELLLSDDIDKPFVSQLNVADSVEEETEVAVYHDENSLSHENDQEQTLSDGWEGLEPLFSDDTEKSFVPQLDVADSVEEETEEAVYQDENSLSHENDQEQTLSDGLEGLEPLFSGENLDSSIQKLSPPVPLVPENLHNSFFDTGGAENNTSPEIYYPGTENSPPLALFPSASPQKESQVENMEISGVRSEKSLSIWSRRGKPQSVEIETSQSRRKSSRISTSSQVKSLFNENQKSELIMKDLFANPDHEEQIFIPEKENCSPKSLLNKSLKSPISSLNQDDEEIFTPDKENMTPETRMLRSMKNIGILEEVKCPKSYRSSPLKRADNCNMYKGEAMLPSFEKESHLPKVLREQKTKSSKIQTTVLKAKTYRDPFRALPVNSSSNNKASSNPSVSEVTKRSTKSISYPKYEEVNHLHVNATKVEKKRWVVLVDTACLLNRKSRMELQLLRGLKGTSLIIPRIVVRELDCMLRRGSFFKRTTEVSAALQWIEECMANTKWWIHVQSSAEEGNLIPPTPPASRHCLNEDKGQFSVDSTPFSPYTLQEIVTPTAEDHILECALFFKRVENGQLVLLSDDVTLKIKAMAEGVVCETAEEFRRSLVNPFSARFLFTDSSPRGPTWSCEDDAVLKEIFYPSPSKKLSKTGEGVKGLKLILLHNSNFRQNTPVS